MEASKKSEEFGKRVEAFKLKLKRRYGLPSVDVPLSPAYATPAAIVLRLGVILNTA